MCILSMRDIQNWIEQKLILVLCVFLLTREIENWTKANTSESLSLLSSRRQNGSAYEATMLGFC